MGTTQWHNFKISASSTPASKSFRPLPNSTLQTLFTVQHPLYCYSTRRTYARKLLSEI